MVLKNNIHRYGP